MCYGYLGRSKKLKFEGGVPDGGQSKIHDIKLGLPFDSKNHEVNAFKRSQGT